MAAPESFQRIKKMHDFLNMGGYGGYVWGAYAVFFIVMAFDAFAARTQRLRQLAQVRGRIKRAAARTDGTR